jgi:hypothetical protein
MLRVGISVFGMFMYAGLFLFFRLEIVRMIEKRKIVGIDSI